MHSSFIIRLDDHGSQNAIRYFNRDTILLTDQHATKTSTVTLLRCGHFRHSEYGEFAVTPELLRKLVDSFNQNAYKQSIFIDVAHNPKNGAAGEIKRLFTDGSNLKADVEWTSYGITANRERKFIYLSAEYTENFTDNETGESKGAVLLGAGLVTRPHIKGMAPVYLSESTEHFSMDKFLKKLLVFLAEHKAPKQLTDALSAAFESEVKKLGDNPEETKVQALYESFTAAAGVATKKLSELSSEQPVNIVINYPEPAPVDNKNKPDNKSQESLDDVVTRKLKEQREKDAKQLAETKIRHEAKLKLFHDTIDGAKSLSEADKTAIKKHGEHITPDTPDSAIKSLAESFIAAHNQRHVSNQLDEIGFTVHGSTQMSVDDSNKIKSLQERIDQSLKLSDAYQNRTLHLDPDKSPNKLFIAKVLAEFDRKHAIQLQNEYRVLADNTTTQTNNAYLPASFQRTVIREALHDLNILQLVQTRLDPTATVTTEIPYEERFGGNIPNDAIVYEGQGINSAGVSTKSCTAYINAMKLALRLSNEIIHFSEKSLVNWNAWGENIASNSRLMQEIINRRLANEMLRASDSVNAQAVSNETLAATNASGITKTAKYPIVRPFQAADLRGNLVGTAENPVVVKVGATTIKQWTGDKDAPSGQYWLFNNLNLGYIQIITHTQGSTTDTPAAGVVATISYSTPTNIIKFDLNHGSESTFKQHLNLLLDAIGDQKSMLSSQRFVKSEYALMSESVNNLASKAEQFAVSLRRDGTSTTVSGDLLEVKGLPAFGTNAPGIDLGDARILIGQRNLTTYTIAKPYMVGQPFEAVDSKGRPTGEKIAYGEEYNSIYTPKPICNRYASVLIFDSTTR